MVKILLMIDDATVGGGQQHVLSLAERFDRQRFRVSVACEGTGYLVDELKNRGIETHALVMSNRLSIRTLIQCAKLLRTVRPDVLHTHGGTAGFVGRMSTLWAPVRGVVHTYHGIHYLHGEQTLVKRLHRMTDRILMRRTDCLICVARADYELGLAHGLLDPGRSKIIRNGIDVGEYERVGAEKKSSGRRLKVVGTIGRLHEQKGHKYFLDAAAKISRRFPETSYQIIGDGELRDDIAARIGALGLGDRVRLMGTRTDVPDLLASMDIFVLPSLWEGLPLVLLEAMAAGVPVVATNVDGNREIIDHECHGLLVPPKDPDSLAAAVCRLLEDTELAHRIAGAARERIRREFSVDQMVRSTEKVYTEVLDRHRRASN